MIFRTKLHRILGGIISSKFISGKGCVILILLHFNLNAALKTTISSGNWSDPTIWSPVGVPSSTDTVIICGGHSIIVDGNFICHSLDLGDSHIGNTTLKITNPLYGLTYTGNLRVNPADYSYTYVLDAGPGTFNGLGTFSYCSIKGTNIIKFGSGAMTISSDTINGTPQKKTVFTGPGTIKF